MSAIANPTELSPIDKPAEVLLRIVPVALAGGGSVTQSIQIDEWLAMLSERHDLPVRRIGVAGYGGGFVDERITGRVYPLDRAITPGSTVAEIYRNVTSTIVQEVWNLYNQKVRHFLAVCCGYTSYGAFALKRAVEEVANTYPDDPISGNVIVQDSSFPDTDALSTELDADGYPVTRFHGPAYQSTPHLHVTFTLNGAVPFDVRLSRRCPPGCTALMTTFPYTPRYLASWQKNTRRKKAGARARLAALLPGWDTIGATDWIVPLIASGGCWDLTSVGKWMTCEQYDTVVQGTLALVQALQRVAKHTSKRVVLPIPRPGAVLAQASLSVKSIEHADQADPPGVVLAPHDVLPQAAFMDLILGADLVVNRAVQANSYVETVLVHKPQLVMTIPAAGYMDAEAMAQALRRGVIQCNQGPEELADEIVRVLEVPGYRRALVRSMADTFTQMYVDPHTNFGDVLTELARVLAPVAAGMQR
jgi:hypothetical protein